jgi:arsenate reductase-like glutaredoxin family protein
MSPSRTETKSAAKVDVTAQRYIIVTTLIQRPIVENGAIALARPVEKIKELLSGS